MTTFDKFPKKCAFCKRESNQPVILSTSSFGAMDLDTRPPYPARSILGLQPQKCPYCHYCNYDIEKIDASLTAFSDEYLKIAQDETLIPHVKNYLLLARLKEESSDDGEAAFCYLKAAWVCDDFGDAESAKTYREKSAEFLIRYLKGQPDEMDKFIMLVDILRRADCFDKAQNVIHKIGKTGEEFLDEILSFELTLILRKDNGRYTVADISQRR